MKREGLLILVASAAHFRLTDASRVHLKPQEQRTLNPHSASNRKTTQENFPTLPLLCHNETAMAE
jgi:hypothetical protein